MHTQEGVTQKEKGPKMAAKIAPNAHSTGGKKNKEGKKKLTHITCLFRKALT